MYHEISDKLIWVSEHEPRWKDWRGRQLYRHRQAVRRNANSKC